MNLYPLLKRNNDKKGIDQHIFKIKHNIKESLIELSFIEIMGLYVVIPSPLPWFLLISILKIRGIICFFFYLMFFILFLITFIEYLKRRHSRLKKRGKPSSLSYLLSFIFVIKNLIFYVSISIYSILTLTLFSLLIFIFIPQNLMVLIILYYVHKNQLYSIFFKIYKKINVIKTFILKSYRRMVLLLILYVITETVLLGIAFIGKINSKTYRTSVVIYSIFLFLFFILILKNYFTLKKAINRKLEQLDTTIKDTSFYRQRVLQKYNKISETRDIFQKTVAFYHLSSEIDAWEGYFDAFKKMNDLMPLLEKWRLWESINSLQKSFESLKATLQEGGYDDGQIRLERIKYELNKLANFVQHCDIMESKIYGEIDKSPVYSPQIKENMRICIQKRIQKTKTTQSLHSIVVDLENLHHEVRKMCKTLQKISSFEDELEKIKKYDVNTWMEVQKKLNKVWTLLKECNLSELELIIGIVQENIKDSIKKIRHSIDIDHSIAALSRKKSAIIDSYTRRYVDNLLTKAQVELTNHNFKKAKAYVEAGLEISRLSKMTGRQFEILVSKLFQRLGYATHLTPSSHDFGVDIIAEKEGDKIAIQVKHWKNKIVPRIVNEALGSMYYYKANNVIVITTSDFTKNARQMAVKIPHLQLWDKKRLLKEIERSYLRTGEGDIDLEDSISTTYKYSWTVS